MSKKFLKDFNMYCAINRMYKVVFISFVFFMLINAWGVTVGILTELIQNENN